MYKEVEINSQEELALYLVNEGDLYADATKAHLKFDRSTKDSCPFRVVYGAGGGTIMGSYWNARETTYYKKVEWFQRIPEGKAIPCYVSDEPEAPGTTTKRLIIAYDTNRSYRFVSSDGMAWRCATPIPADELWRPE